jgi:hypothetical protein
MHKDYVIKRGVPLVTPRMANSVSQYRRESLQEETEAGLFTESRSGFKPKSEETAIMPIYSSTPLSKFATTSGVGGTGYSGQSGTVRQVPEIYSPLWLTSNLNLPRDRATINAWSRAFFALNPVVQNAISLHSTYPISKLNIKCHDKKVENFFMEMAEEIDLFNTCIMICQEYWLLGEAIPYAQLDGNKWGRIVLQNPDYVVLKNSVVSGEPMISLRPDENLKKIITSNRPADVQQRAMIDDVIIDYVKKGKNIPLNNFYVSHIARRLSPQDLRGTGLVTSCFKQLMLFDILRESKFHQAYNLINPITLIKVGGGADNFKPTPEALQEYRDIWEAAQYDRDFKIFTHEGVTVERVGANGAIIDIGPDITQLLKEIYIGLMVPQVLMDGGNEVTYANGTVSLDVLRQRYFFLRNYLAAWLRKKIFAPISKINEFYEYSGGMKKYIVPEVEWNHMSLFDTGDYLTQLVALADGEDKSVSKQTVYRSLGLDYKDEKRRLREEEIDRAIRTKEAAALATMKLAELRTLNPDSEIVEGEEQALPGQTTPGEEPSGEMPPEMPGMPEMPEMPATPPPPPAAAPKTPPPAG